MLMIALNLVGEGGHHFVFSRLGGAHLCNLCFSGNLTCCSGDKPL